MYSKGSPIHLKIESDDSYLELFNQKIEFGPMVQILNGTLGIPFSEITDWLQGAEDDDNFEILLVGVEVHEEFVDRPKKKEKGDN